MKTVLREPLLHFLALGALLFLYFEWRGRSSGSGGSHIVISEGIVQNLAAGFTRTWTRPPTPEELKGLLDEYVKEEIATREAIAMGLDRDDAVVRRRLRQKLEFLAEEAEEQAPPTEAELLQWLNAHAEAFAAEPRVALRQVFVSASARGAAAERDALALLKRLRAAGRDAMTDALGDPSLLPQELPLVPATEVARTFGSAFAAGLDGLPERQWSGPVESAYGLHLVLVTGRAAPPPATLAEIRPLVLREVLAERQRKRLEALYTNLLEKYTVTIEKPTAEPALASATPQVGAR